MNLFNYKGKKVYLKQEQYSHGDTLAVAMYTKDDELYDVITTNLLHPMQSDSMAFVDENNHTGIGKWLVKNCLAYPLAYHRQSGFCSYPLYTFFTKEF